MNRKLTFLAIVAVPIFVFAVIGALRLASDSYLKKNHSTLLGTFFSLLVPPLDIYSVIWSGPIERGTVAKVELTFNYAGGHSLRLIGGGGAADLTGYLRCEAMSVPLGFKRENFSHDKGNYVLGTFKIEGDMTGRPMECQIFTAGSGLINLEIKKISDV